MCLPCRLERDINFPLISDAYPDILSALNDLALFRYADCFRAISHLKLMPLSLLQSVDKDSGDAEPRKPKDFSELDEMRGRLGGAAMEASRARRYAYLCRGHLTV